MVHITRYGLYYMTLSILNDMDHMIWVYIIWIDPYHMDPYYMDPIE